jgi:predicted choloylglycine hydrolase
MTFHASDDGRPESPAWAARVRPEWPHVGRHVDASTWTSEGRAAAVASFAEHMPELVPVMEELAASIDLPEAGAVLTQATLKPFFAACSQTGVAGTLVRNYDFDPAVCSRVISRTEYLRLVIGMSEFLWGLLDGMNDAGLAVSLTFGGRFVHRPGMSILLVVRYLLETCDTVEQAWERLRRIPMSTAQNLTLVDHEQTLSVFVGPDIEATRADGACVTNHQLQPVGEEQENDTHTLARLAAITAATETARAAAATGDPDPSRHVVAALLRPPLYNSDYTSGLGTIYTAAYRPTEGRVAYHWPDGQTWPQSFTDFRPGTRDIKTG